jgi:hypothetical protein
MTDIVAIAQAALESVEPGPWDVEESISFPDNAEYRVLDVERAHGGYRNSVYCGTDQALAVFIATARNSLIPDLIAEIERLRAGGSGHNNGDQP